MNEEFVLFELAKKLKEKGYTKETSHNYDELGRICVSLVGEEYPYPCPQIHQVLKWLREEKKIFVEIVITPMGLYKPMIYDIGGFKKPYRDISPRIDFNEAAIAGIEYAIDNLI